MSSKNLEAWAEVGVIVGKYEYVPDAKTREMIPISSEYIYENGSVSGAITELSYYVEYGDDLEYAVELYTDAACTAEYAPYADTNSDLTIYVNWNGEKTKKILKFF